MQQTRLFGTIMLGMAASLAWSAGATEAPLTAADRRAIVDDLGKTLEANYVFPDKAKTVAATLRAHLDKGDYDDAGDKGALAEWNYEDVRYSFYTPDKTSFEDLTDVLLPIIYNDLPFAACCG